LPRPCGRGFHGVRTIPRHLDPEVPVPQIAYIDKTFTGKSLAVIDQANQICADYQRQGYDLTLRQLYYQFVSRDLIANKDTEYKRLGNIINDARLAGLLDWNYIVDRTRNLRGLAHWDNPGDILDGAAFGYRTDRWANQPYHVEVWIEKDALVGVIAGACDRLDVPYFSCRGYTSQSELWGAARRLIYRTKAGQKNVIIHLGDHDPSGIDMTRDITDRLALFGAEATVERIALNMDQVRRYSPPPNPAKLTDARAEGYIATHGTSSWELDALDPSTLDALVQSHILNRRDDTQWNRDTEAMQAERDQLTTIARRFNDVTRYLQNLPEDAEGPED
jgi:hypothetical protein